ncbi:MAG: NAD(P)/FAD-dependent oxidoreductase [Elainellaceae cyanobacterium]
MSEEIPTNGTTVSQTVSQNAVDVAIVGAGLSGLICGRSLRQQGYRTLILEKSRGLGGRLATRRIETATVDHGVRYLENQGPHTQNLIEQMTALGVTVPAAAPVAIAQAGDQSLGQMSQQPILQEPVYVAPQGMTAIAKALAANLTVHRQHRVERIAPQSDCWCLQMSGAEHLRTATARAVVLAIPAPQVVQLLQPLVSDLENDLGDEIESLLQAASAVEFAPCFSVMVGYPNGKGLDQLGGQPGGQLGLLFSNAQIGHDLRWIGFEGQKRTLLNGVVVLQSSTVFAQQALDRLSLDQVTERLLTAAQRLPQIAALGEPQWTQTHRWRYGFCHRPHPQSCLNALAPLPLVCCGDWCGGSTLEQAIQSGLSAAQAIATALG